MSTNHWQGLFRAWSTLQTPVRVASEVIDGIKAEVADVRGPILLLGMTSGLLDASADITAVDQSSKLVGDLWPGNAPGRRAVIGDWLRLPFAPASFAACIGDGSLISFDYPDRLQQLFDGLAICLKPGGRFSCRVFLAPDRPETIADLEAAIEQRRTGSFQHFKFRLAMAIASELGGPNILVTSIPEIFDLRFPDRSKLAGVTGWDRSEIDTIDVYRGSNATYAFPTATQLISAIPKAFRHPRFVPVAKHPMGTQWPVLVMELG
jgi:SAM-dependent methyltransferase